MTGYIAPYNITKDLENYLSTIYSKNNIFRFNYNIETMNKIINRRHKIIYRIYIRLLKCIKNQSYRPIFILEEFDTLSPMSQESFRKISLEDTHIILLVNKIEHIIEPIRNRCIIISNIEQFLLNF